MRGNLSTIGALVVAVVSILQVSLGVVPSFAQVPRIEIPSSINPVGSGARALGMGGAFIAVADDATAASWNPGGLIQLERPEVSIVGAYFKRDEDNSFGERPEASGLQDVGKYNINYLSAAYPFNQFNRNMVLSLNYQNLYDFTRKWDLSNMEITEDIFNSKDIHLEQEGSLNAIGLAYCVQVTPHLSFGLTLNIWQNDLGSNGWEQKQKYAGSAVIADVVFPYTAEQSDRYTFSGFNTNLGILWNLTNRMVFGAVLKTPFTADLKHKRTEGVEYEGFEGYTLSYEEDEELDMPMSYGIGLSYRFSDRLTVAIDIYRTEWDEYVLRDADGNEVSPVNNKPTDEAEIDPTNQVRIGCEYLHITNSYAVPIRGGIFYDPAPAEGRPDDYYGFSLGSGMARGKVVFDIAYQYRFGNDVAGHLYDNLDFSQDLREHTLYASIIYHF